MLLLYGTLGQHKMGDVVTENAQESQRTSSDNRSTLTFRLQNTNLVSFLYAEASHLALGGAVLLLRCVYTLSVDKSACTNVTVVLAEEGSSLANSGCMSSKPLFRYLGRVAPRKPTLAA